MFGADVRSWSWMPDPAAAAPLIADLREREQAAYERLYVHEADGNKSQELLWQERAVLLPPRFNIC